MYTHEPIAPFQYVTYKKREEGKQQSRAGSNNREVRRSPRSLKWSLSALDNCWFEL